ncbi:MAG: hypothetical protein ACTHNQ_18055 [Microbacterium sp.]
MPAVTSAWRANDVVAYDAMRTAATRLTAALLSHARRTDHAAERARDELIRLREDVAAVDGYDRTAVIALKDRIQARLRELEERTP